MERYTEGMDRYAGQVFSAFKARKDEGPATAGVRLALQEARRMAHKPSGWLVLYGPPGTGKTHLVAAISNQLTSLPEADRPLSLFFTAPDLLDLLRSGYQQNDYHDMLRLCQSVEVLMLDDLGAERTNEWVREKLFQILDHRYQRRLPLVVVTNCALEELEPRIKDRLTDTALSTIVQIVAPSYRQRVRQKTP